MPAAGAAAPARLPTGTVPAALPASGRAPSGSTMRGTSRHGAPNSTIGDAPPQAVASGATATPCSAGGSPAALAPRRSFSA